MTDDTTPADTPTPVPATAIRDVRHTPLNDLIGATGDALRRIVPAEDSTSVPVAAFNASL